MVAIKVIKDYGTHKSEEEYAYSPEDHCPSCGLQTVYYETGPGDYYVGEQHVCISCKSEWTIQGPEDAGKYELQVIEQIKEKDSAFHIEPVRGWLSWVWRKGDRLPRRRVLGYRYFYQGIPINLLGMEPK